MTECFGRCSQGVVVDRSLSWHVMVMMMMMMLRRVGVLMWVMNLIRKRWNALRCRKAGHAHFSILPKSQLDEHILPVMGIQLRSMVGHRHIIVRIVNHLSWAASDNSGPCL